MLISGSASPAACAGRKATGEMDFDAQMQLLCLFCFIPMGVVFTLAVLYSWAHPGPAQTDQERKEQEQAEELMGELLWLEQDDRDHHRKMARRE